MQVTSRLFLTIADAGDVDVGRLRTEDVAPVQVGHGRRAVAHFDQPGRDGVLLALSNQHVGAERALTVLRLHEIDQSLAGHRHI